VRVQQAAAERGGGRTGGADQREQPDGKLREAKFRSGEQNVTVVQKQPNASNTQAPISARQRSTGSARAVVRTLRICSR